MTGAQAVASWISAVLVSTCIVWAMSYDSRGSHQSTYSDLTSPPASPHRQLVVEALQSDNQAVLSGHQLVLQLSHVGLIGRLGQVVGQDVHKEVKQNQAEEEQHDETE